MSKTTDHHHHTGAGDDGSRSRIASRYILYLTLGALGVVYGDIGTSPLYAFRESFHGSHGLPVTQGNVLGILSLIFWSLVIVISFKYIVFVMRADNHGEGGIMALTALIQPRRGATTNRLHIGLTMLGLFGTALLYGDGMITPAISVLSAVEGLQVATPFFEPYILPITILILVGLFFLQSRGTERVGKIFGPTTLVWFAVLALLGARWIWVHPSVLLAVNPVNGLEFFERNGWTGFLVLGSVFLVVTGGEALYADMGHFGRRPIRLAWFTVVLPALMLNYFGQGALLIEHPEAVENPFFGMAPDWALYPLVLIATAATVIASQALITGAFSLTMQAIQLGYLPRMEIRHTSSSEFGQIYIPGINWALMVACVALVITFGSSSKLASAYGVAVTTTMVITALLLYVIQRERWGWGLWTSIAFTSGILVVDLAFWGANIIKLFDGGWIPLVIGLLVFTLMLTWKQGREILARRLKAGTMRFADFAEQVRAGRYDRVPGIAVFMYSDPEGTPPALLHNLEHNKVLHEHVILLSVRTEERPYVLRKDRVELQNLENGFHQVILHYGFMEFPHVPRDLSLARRQGLEIKPLEASYFLGRERLQVKGKLSLASWRNQLFAVMSRNSRNATDFFRLPLERVVELGAQVEF